MRDADVAVDATLRAAAARGALPLTVLPDDLRGKIREHRSPLSVCLVVDNSYSLHADRLVETVKGIALRLLEDAAHRGDRIALVAFKGGVPEATVALPLTRSLTRARRRLAEIPLSGRTPLADALARSRRLLRQELRKRPNAHPLVVCVTDGLPTVALASAWRSRGGSLDQARALRRCRHPLRRRRCIGARTPGSAAWRSPRPPAGKPPAVPSSSEKPVGDRWRGMEESGCPHDRMGSAGP